MASPLALLVAAVETQLRAKAAGVEDVQALTRALRDLEAWLDAVEREAVDQVAVQEHVTRLEADVERKRALLAREQGSLQRWHAEVAEAVRRGREALLALPEPDPGL